LGEVSVQLVPARLRERHYGEVVAPDRTTVLRRENVYGSGPQIEQASPQIVDLILGYLSAGSSIVDVGCGAGAFGPGLIEAGHEWLGLEVNDHCIELLDRRVHSEKEPEKRQGSKPAAYVKDGDVVRFS